MRYGLLGAIAAIAVGIAIGALLPVPGDGAGHEEGLDDGGAVSTERSIARATDRDDEPSAQAPDNVAIGW